MTDPNRFPSLIKQPSDSQDVKAWLAELKAPAPKLKKGDVKAWVALPKSGIDLVFTDEAAFTKRKDLALGEGALLLTSISLRSAVPDYSDYRGPLPEGLVFGDSPEQVHKKLGQPQKVHDFLPLEFWTKKGIQLSATYDESKTKLEEVSLSIQ